MEGKDKAAIPFIYLDEQEQGFKVSEEAGQFLQGLEPSIELGICCVVGKYRTGKSYIINKALVENKESPFEVGNTINSCTKGLWLYNQVLEAENGTRYLVIDTEGLGSCEETAQVDTQIFLFGLLLASYLIYNSKGHLDENTINDMSMFVNVARDLHSKQMNMNKRKSVAQALPQHQEAEEAGKGFPQFLWIVRDFSLKLVDKEGKKINSKEYLEKALEPQKGQSDHIEYKNRMKKLFKAFFKERDCMPMIRPLENEKDLQNLMNLPDHMLRPEFLDQLKTLKNKIKKKIQAKVVNGSQKINGHMLLTLAQNYVTTINQGGMPNIDYVWNQVAKSYQQQQIDSLMASIVLRLQQVQDDPELRHNKAHLKKLREELRAHCHQSMRNNTAGWSENQLTPMLALLDQQITKKYASVKEETKKMRQVQYEQVCTEGLQEIENNLRTNEYNDFEGFKQDFMALKKQFVDNPELAGDRQERHQFFLKEAHSLLMLGGDIISSKLVKQKRDQKRMSLDKVDQIERLTSDRIIRIQQENEQLKDKVKEMQKDHQLNSSTSEQLKHQMLQAQKSSDGQLEELNSQLQNQKQISSQLQTKLEEVQSSHKQKVQAIDDHHQKANQQLNQQILDLNITNMEYTKQKDLLERQLDQANNEIRRAERQLGEKDNKINDLNKELALYGKNLDTQLKETIQNKTEIQKQLDTMRSENNKLQQKLKQAEKKANSQENFEKEVKSLRNKIQQKNNVEDSLMNFFQRASNNLIGIEKYKEIQDANNMLNNALRTLEQRNEELVDKIKNLKNYKKVINFCQQFKCNLCGACYDNIVIVTHIQLCLQQYQQKFLGKQFGESQPNTLENTQSILRSNHHLAVPESKPHLRTDSLTNLRTEKSQSPLKDKQKNLQDTILKKILNYNQTEQPSATLSPSDPNDKNYNGLYKNKEPSPQLQHQPSPPAPPAKATSPVQQAPPPKQTGPTPQNDFVNINININKKEEKQVYSFSSKLPKEIQQLENMKISIYQSNIKEDKSNKPYMEYMIYCQKNNKNWIVRRKFMDFCNLNKGLKDLYQEQYTQFFQFEAEFQSDESLASVLHQQTHAEIDERREKLQSYLRALSRLDIFQESEIFQIFINQNQSQKPSQTDYSLLSEKHSESKSNLMSQGSGRLSNANKIQLINQNKSPINQIKQQKSQVMNKFLEQKRTKLDKDLYDKKHSEPYKKA